MVFFATITKAARWQTTQAARGQLVFACLNMDLPHSHSEGTPQEDAIDTRLAFRFQNAGWNRPALHNLDEQANNLGHQVHRAWQLRNSGQKCCQCAKDNILYCASTDIQIKNYSLYPVSNLSGLLLLLLLLVLLLLVLPALRSSSGATSDAFATSELC